MQLKWKIITTWEDFLEATIDWDDLIACDTETYGKDPSRGKLLGISLSPSKQVTHGAVGAIYIPLYSFNNDVWEKPAAPDVIEKVGKWVSGKKLVGHNFTYDKKWLDAVGIPTNWAADTRIMWHLASAPAGPRPYGLKDAQKEVLGWTNTNEDELDFEVKARGGSLKKGDHYLAPLEVLGKYASLDAFSTIQLHNTLLPFFEENSYFPLLSKMMVYNQLLDWNTTQGILVDKEGLQKSHDRLLSKKEAAKNRFHKELKEEIQGLEEAWRDRKLATYKRDYNKERYLNHPEEWKKFNLNSDKDKRELFFDVMDLPVVEETEKGLPSTGADTLKNIQINPIKSYLIYEKSNTLTSNFTKPYIESSQDGRLHPGFNICGTVSYRLSGFKPYLLNAPFDERIVMKNLKCDEGFGGVHADLSAVEPSVTAHYSEDPSLLKVFRDGLGDIYLDLALELFPNDKELKDGYNPCIPVTRAVKERFARQRKVAKVIQLAVQYTGTGYTVARNLSKDGIPTTPTEANLYVRKYWEKFRAVARFNETLRKLYYKEGHLRNIIGRIIRVPNPEYKDLPNRFIQSSGHDILILWVLEIYRLAKERNIDIRPILLDCHDSTSNQCPLDQVDTLKLTYLDALDTINKQLELSVTIKADIKTFSTLAGLKAEE